jgi:cytochrome P450
MAEADVFEAPAHVPRDLVRPWPLESDPETESCPFHAAAKMFDGPPIFYCAGTPATAWQPCWVVVPNALQREVLQTTENFLSSGSVTSAEDFGEGIRFIPLATDGAYHSAFRTVLNPLFSPARVNEMEAGVRQLAVELIEKVRADGACDFMEAFGRPFPITVFLRLLGLPPEEMPQFMQWGHWFLHHTSSNEDRIRAVTEIAGYLGRKIAERQANPTKDLIGFAAAAKVDGRPWTAEEILGFCVFFFIAGLDTVASVLGFTFRELARRPELQQRLRDDPSLVNDAVEEMVRAHGVVITARRVIRDCEFHGVAMKAGDLIALPGATASRDPAEYPDPHTIDFARENTRNLSFAAGPHRCIGSHLARREIKIAIEEWIARAPNLRLDPDRRAVTHGSVVVGFETLPLVWDSRGAG